MKDEDYNVLKDRILSDDAFYAEFIKRLRMDEEVLNFIRSAFATSIEKNLSINVVVESAVKRCSVCKSPMILRASRKNGGYFWGCAGYPRCRNLEQATDEDVVEYAKSYPSQFAVLEAQAKAFKEEYEIRMAEEALKPKRKRRKKVEDVVEDDDKEEDSESL